MTACVPVITDNYRSQQQETWREKYDLHTVSDFWLVMKMSNLKKRSVNLHALPLCEIVHGSHDCVTSAKCCEMKKKPNAIRIAQLQRFLDFQVMCCNRYQRSSPNLIINLAYLVKTSKL